MHQHHTEVAALGTGADVFQDLRRIRMGGGSVLRRDVPVDPLVAFFLTLGNETLG